MRARIATRRPVRTLLVFGREPGALRNIYASGGRGFLNDMLAAAGGVNVLGDLPQEAVQATTELLLTRAPDVILEVREGPVYSAARVAPDGCRVAPPGVASRRQDRAHPRRERRRPGRARSARGRGRRPPGAGAASRGVHAVKILVSWSSGKDAAWMLHRLQVEHPGAVQGLLTTTNEAFDRVAMHGVPRDVLEAQAQAAGLPLHVVPLPWPCSNDEYERRMGAAVAGFVADGLHPRRPSATCSSRPSAATARNGWPGRA